MYQKKLEKDIRCPLEYGLSVFGGKWKSRIIVHPDYQGQGIAGEMLERIKEKYKNYLYLEGMPEDKKNVPFYEKHGFQRMEHGAVIQICNYSDKR